MRRLSSWFFLALTLTNLAFAEESVTVRKWHAAGTRGCSKNDIQLIANGNSFSFLFNSFQSELRAGERRDGYTKTSACVLSIELEVPQNRCISALDQTVSGGVLKSASTYGSVHFLSWLNGSAPVNKQIRWKLGNEITAEEEESLFTITTRSAPRCLKLKRQWYVAYLYLHGGRTKLSEEFLGAIDSIDGELTLKMRLQ